MTFRSLENWKVYKSYQKYILGAKSLNLIKVGPLQEPYKIVTRPYSIIET